MWSGLGKNINTFLSDFEKIIAPTEEDVEYFQNVLAASTGGNEGGNDTIQCAAEDNSEVTSSGNIQTDASYEKKLSRISHKGDEEMYGVDDEWNISVDLDTSMEENVDSICDNQNISEPGSIKIESTRITSEPENDESTIRIIRAPESVESSTRITKLEHELQSIKQFYQSNTKIHERTIDLLTIENKKLKVMIQDNTTESERFHRNQQFVITEYETKLKDAEEMVWTTKAELSELLFAYEKEQKLVQNLKCQLNDQPIVSSVSNTSTITTESFSSDAELHLANERILSLQNQLENNEKKLLQLQDEVTTSHDTAACYQEKYNDSFSQIAQLKGAITKLDSENKQLNVIINQLRSARRTSKEDIDTVVTERDELKQQLLQRDKTIQELNEKITFQDEIETVEAELDKYKGQYTRILGDHENLKNVVSRLEKELYDKKNALEVLQVDNLGLQEDLDSRQIELQNLHLALENMRNEGEQKIRQLVSEHATKVASIEHAYSQSTANSETSYRKTLQEYEDTIKNLTITCDDVALLQRKYEIDLNHEKKKMQQQLNEALNQLGETKGDVVDRVLVTNLIVNYFERNRSREVLGLIARILLFTDEQKEIVGLKVPPTSKIISSLFNSIITGGGIIAPTDSSDPLRQNATPLKPKVEGNNLAELWVNFLIAESESEQIVKQGGDDKASSVDSTPRSKSSCSSDSSLFLHDEFHSSRSNNISALKLQISNINENQTQNHPLHFTLQPPSPNFERGVRNEYSDSVEVTKPNFTEADNSRFRPRVNSDDSNYEDVNY